jgi:putative transposase
MSALVVADSEVGTAELCQSLGVSRASLYRSRQPARPQEPKPPRAKHPRALDRVERQAVLDMLHSERFCDQSPAEVHATLLEEQTYLCAPRTMYRLLRQAHEVRERRDQLRHPHYTKPELVATGPNQVWSWDITKLKGPIKWAYFQLYVILDIFSRQVVGWMVARNESAHLAERLIEETCTKQGIPPGQLTIHADRGAAMTSKAVALLFSDLGIEGSHSRPHISDDNPFSESHFRTIKYRPEFPDRFGSLEHARQVCRALFTWYNTAHHHSSLAFLTPAAVHHGRAAEVLHDRHRVLLAAYAAHPERFVNGPPRRQSLQTAVWINPPEKTTHQDALRSTIASPDDPEVVPVCRTYAVSSNPRAGPPQLISSAQPLQ